MNLHVLVHSDSTGIYWGECAELPGCFSQGTTRDELMANMKEAAALYLEHGETVNEISDIVELVV